jgi:hypothetical protein
VGVGSGSQQNFVAALEEGALQQAGQHQATFGKNNCGAMPVARESFRSGYGRWREGLRVEFARRGVRRRLQLIFAKHRRAHRGVRERVNQDEAAGRTVALIGIEK